MKKNSLKAFLAVFIASFVIFSGCGAPADGTGGSENQNAVVLEEGWTNYQPEGETYGLALPTEWKFVDLSKGDLNSSDLPLDSNVLSGFKAQGVKFFGFEPNKDGGKGVVNVSIVSQPLNGVPFSLEQFANSYEKTVKAQMPSATINTNEEVTLPAGKARKVQLTGDLGNDVKFSTLQYALVGDKSYYIITFSYMPDKADQYEPLFDKMINTFKF